jgi:hypothetical protein
MPPERARARILKPMNATFFKSGSGLARAGLLLSAALMAAGFAGCDPLDSADSSAEASMAPELPDTLYYGSEYMTVLAFRNCVSPCAWTVSLSDTLLAAYETTDPESFHPFWLRARGSRDTLRIIASGGDQADTLLKVLHGRAMGGFAPIESSRVMTWLETVSQRNCSSDQGGSQTQRVTFTPLGPVEDAYRFEHKVVSSTGSPILLDTLLLRRVGNVVQAQADTGWVSAGLYPFFAQDTLSGELSAIAGLEGPAVGYLGASASPERGTYRQGTGLVHYRLASGFSICGATYTRTVLLME